MPRPPSFVIPGLPQHLIARGNNREPIFAAEEDYSAYRALFNHELSEKTLEETRDAANKGWALGSSSFLQKSEAILDRPMRKQARGGDRKSERYRKRRYINRN